MNTVKFIGMDIHKKTITIADGKCQSYQDSNFNPRNTPCIHVVKIFTCLELE